MNNDLKHTSKSTSELFKQTKQRWASQSLELNSNEMVLHDLNRAFNAWKPSSVPELKQFYKEEWAKIAPQR